ncbi:response regulator transcription factor [Eggerthellaceae bacterium 24-137]
MADAPLIYYVEDDGNIRDLTSYALRQAGFEVRAFPDGEGFVEACRAEPPAAALLDIMLPGEDGLSLVARLRGDAATENIPVMMLTAKGTEFDKVSGLDAGADDYLAKPFGMMELVSRVNALLRRAARPARGAVSSPVVESGQLVCGPVVLTPEARTATAAGVELPLTRKEFDLLRVLLENKGRVLTREQLLDRVWGVSFVGETRTVDMHVKTLRKKLAAAAPGAEETVGTVRGVGYRLREVSL